MVIASKLLLKTRQILPVGHNARWADAQRRVADIVRWSRYPLGGRTLSHAGLRSGMIVTMPVSSMVFFRPLIWLAGSSFAHIFDSGFPRENYVSILIGTVRTQRDEAFVLAYLNDLDAHCHRITNMDRSDKFQRLPQIDAPRSGKIHPDRRRDQGADEEAVGNPLTERRTCGIVCIQVNRIAISTHLGKTHNIVIRDRTLTCRSCSHCWKF